MGPRHESSVSTDFRFRSIPLPPAYPLSNSPRREFCEDGEDANFPGRERTLAQASQDAKGEFQ